MKKYIGNGLKDGMVIINDENGKPLFNLPTFIPSQSLVEIVNFAFYQKCPLLITGEKYRIDMVASAVAYELYGNNFLPHYTRWLALRDASFSDGFYTYDDERRKKDLEYSRLDPVNNPIKESLEYFKTGPLLKVWNQVNKDQEIPTMLEIRNVHLADEHFLTDLMHFLIYVSEINIPELDKVINKTTQSRPCIILTAESGFQLPKNYEGTIYTYEMPEPKKEELLQETLTEVGSWWNLEKTPLTKEGYHDKSRAVYVRDDPNFPEFKILIEKLMDLYFLIKDSNILQPGNTSFPMSILELRNTIQYKAVKVLIEGESAEKEIEKIEHLIDSQYKMTQSADLSESVEVIRNAVKNAKLNNALKSLELITNQLPGELQNEAIQLIARHRGLTRTEMMGTESSLFLYPQKNKLTLDLLQFLNKV